MISMVVAIVLRLVPWPEAFEVTEGFAFWANFSIHSLTVVLTILAMLAKDVYKTLVEVGSLYSIDIYINLWALILKVENVNTNAAETTESPVNCCLTISLGGTDVKLINFSDSQYQKCGQVRVMQTNTILITLMSLFAAVSMLLQRYWKNSDQYGWLVRPLGLASRLVFALSSLCSIIGLVLMMDLKNVLAGAVSSAPSFRVPGGALQYAFGFYVNVTAMILKLAAVCFVAFELIAYRPPPVMEDQLEKQTESAAEVHIEEPEYGPSFRGCCGAGDVPEPAPVTEVHMNA